jgi:hypothetical protein
MRRFLIIGACLVGLSWMVWLLWRMSAAAKGVSQADEDAVVIPEPEPEIGGEAEVQPGSYSAESVVDRHASDRWDGSEQVAVSESAADLDEARADLEEVAPESYRRSQLSASSYGDREELLGELQQVRREVLKEVERPPLYEMAEERGVPHFRRFFMSNGKLLDAILDAEGVPPADVSPSPETVVRVRALALEMFQRNEAYVAAVTPERRASG